VLVFALGLLLGLAVGALCWWARESALRLALQQAQQEAKGLRERNDALTEAVSNRSGAPVVMPREPRELEKIPGWFDVKQQDAPKQPS